MLPKGSAEVNEKHEQEIPLNWARRAGRPAKPKPTAAPPPARIPRITRLMALAIKFQEMVDRGEVHDYADIARLGFVTRARLTQIMNLLLLAPNIQEVLLSEMPPMQNSIPERTLRAVAQMVLWEDQKCELANGQAESASAALQGKSLRWVETA
jgi:hypothetical protein